MMEKHNVKYSDPFDWELIGGVSTIPGKRKFRKKLSRILTMSEDTSVARTVENDKTQEDLTAEELLEQQALPFNVEDFSKNELGF
ncbi:hypothetical protein M3Y97_00211200 [Aphelenchoides bicaudatus]|nr:hypothetical protein M3Y97_00211200 [Aphelenchoides bicaudatus]